MDKKQFIIPVEYSMYSTVIVEGAADLKEAMKIVEDNLDEIPLPSSSNAEYIDGSYKVSVDCDEDLQNAQSYATRGVLLDATNGIKYNVL